MTAVEVVRDLDRELVRAEERFRKEGLTGYRVAVTVHLKFSSYRACWDEINGKWGFCFAAGGCTREERFSFAEASPRLKSALADKIEELFASAVSELDAIRISTAVLKARNDLPAPFMLRASIVVNVSQTTQQEEVNDQGGTEEAP